MTLTVEDFDAFHRAVHGYDSFGWQRRLLRTIVQNRRWPRVLDLPTGSGKTTCIDVALFALAIDASSPPTNRWCPRRIALVVDRRVVVDQAAERGRKILSALSESNEQVIAAVRSALRSMVGDQADPLGVFTLRGGIPKDDSWAGTPHQPLIIASTVDQLGSRMLMQGYGVSPGMRPIHAGLAGNDILLLLDEVHLSQPFRQTLLRLEALRERFHENGLPHRFQFSFLSATPGDDDAEAFRLTDDELTPTSPLGPRLHARKRVRIVKVHGREELASRVVTLTRDLVSRHTAVAAIVNRVDTALNVYARLRPELHDDVVLLTGRMRPLDRDDVLSACRSRIVAGLRRRGESERRFVIVGTQCIEAGADFDFDALVSESASFDALRQRFGRVDRLGLYRDEAGLGAAEGFVVHDREIKDDPVYGDRISSTIKWLEARIDRGTKTIDFGNRCLLDAPAELMAPKPDAPTLLPAYLDLWSQTSPAPAVVAEGALFLHGPQTGLEEVQVVWRGDLSQSGIHPKHELAAVAAVAAVPPSSLEAIALPLHTVRRWLGDLSNPLEGVTDAEVRLEATGAGVTGRWVLLWRGERSTIVDVWGVRPGDTVVVPSSSGGIDPDSRCFDASSRSEVQDMAERASMMGRGLPVLRLHPRVLSELGCGAVDPEQPDGARSVLQTLSTGFDDWRRPWADWLASGGRIHPILADVDGTGGRALLRAPRVPIARLRTALASWRHALEDGHPLTTDEDDASYQGLEVRLDAHIRSVEKLAREFSRQLGFSDALINDVALAAWLHDIGKADPRFQRMLVGGSEIASYRNEGRLLAKSGTISVSRVERREAQRRSTYPTGMRHEVQSVAMIESVREIVRHLSHDFDLVVHLVASHHGRCRPFAPAVDDAVPVDVSLADHVSDQFGTLTFEPLTSANRLHRLDSPLADRFWSLTAKYGWLELCWLETVLRLADHRASEGDEGVSL